ncbi:hypothetical protein [Helicobacter rodentium]|uniref:hypothetical protein n=1 Tax=Helicobacter rodentium TaxID=59617 RepID=UPI0023F27F4B|nr:hypothetical protein [Helicobacter rodentium]
MDKREFEAKETMLNQKEQELNTREQKLNKFATKLKEEQEKLKKEQTELQNSKENYKQEVEDNVNATFNERVNKAIEKQAQALQKEQETLLEKQKDFHTKEIALKEKEQELELRALKIENAEKELNNNYGARLQEEKRAKLAEYDNKLESEFSEKFKEKIDSLEQEQKQIAEQKARLREKEIELDAEKKGFESSKERKLEMLQNEVQAELDSLNRQLENEKAEREKLQSVYDELVEAYGEYERFKNRDLISENQDLENERRRLEKRLKQVEEEAEKRINKFQDQDVEKENFYNEQLDEIKRYNTLKEKFNQKEIECRNLKEKLREQDYYENQCKILDERLRHLQSQFMGKEEQMKREEAIKQEYALEIQLNSENKCKENNELDWLNHIESCMKKYGVEYPQRLLYAFHTALKTATMSPLSVLSGVSGTGKSELPKLYAYFGGFNFLSEAVQPTWDSPASMVGFYNTIEGKFDSTNLFKFLVQTSIDSKDENAPNPYGLKESMNLILLDELNLAHIELYFAEFLSKFEIKRGSNNVNLDIPIGAGLTMPIELDSNLLWVGTMNEDETTKSLSDKVLDRAFCLNFPRPKNLVSRLDLKKLNEIYEFKWLPKTTWENWVNESAKKTKNIDLEEYREITEQINEKLALAHRAIGHRVWQSMEAYMLNYPLVNGDREEAIKIAFEDAIVQKIMPKLRGIELHGKEKYALMGIKDIIAKKTNLEKDFDYAMDNPYGQFKFNSAYYLDSKANVKETRENQDTKASDE